MSGRGTPVIQRALRGDETALLQLSAGHRKAPVTRAFVVDDIGIRSRAQGGDGRIVDAYAAVFGTEAEIVDQDGHYLERNDPAAFNRSVADRRAQIFCVYNHAKTLQGTPSDTYSVPLGEVVNIQPDDYGLLTSVRYNTDEASDRILQAIKSGSLKGMSYTGVFVRSSPELGGPYDMFAANKSGDLQVVTRQEIALIEFGPTPIPAFDTADVVGVRNREAINLVIPEGVTIRMVTPPERAKKKVTSGADDTGGGPGGTMKVKAARADCPDCEGSGLMPGNIGCLTCGATGRVDDGYDGTTAASEKGRADPRPLGSTPDTDAAEDAAEGPETGMPDAEDIGEMDDHDAGEGDAKSDGESTHREYGRAQCPDCTGRGDVFGGMTCARCGGIGVVGRGDPRPLGTPPGEAGDQGEPPGGGNLSDSADDDESHRADSGGSPKPYGNGTYADPKNGKYPIDTKEHAKAAWSYINMPKNAAKYPLNGVSLSSVKAKIKAACKKFGIEITTSGGDGGKTASSSSSGRKPDTAAAGHSVAAATGHSASNSHDRNDEMPGVNDRTWTIEERTERIAEIKSRFNELDAEYAGGELPEQTRAEWNDLGHEKVLHERAVADATARAEYLRQINDDDAPGTTEGIDNGLAGYGGPGYGNLGTRFTTPNGGRQAPGFVSRQNAASVFDLAAIRNRATHIDQVPALYRDSAMRAIEMSAFPGVGARRDGNSLGITKEDAQTRVADLLERVDDENGTLARRILVTGSPIYDRAFGKALKAQNLYGLTQEESRALQLGTDSAGGFAVPFQLDPTVLLTSNGAINPLRQIARVEQITGKEWDGVTSAGITVSRATEGTEVASVDAVFAQPTVRTQRVQGFVPFNIELDVSWGALRSQMTALLMDAKDVEEATAFVVGSGTAPAANGIINTLGTASYVKTAGSAVIAASDIYLLENAMAPRFRQQASYLASKTTYNRIRVSFQVNASAATDFWVRPTVGTPAELNGYPAYESSQMSAATSTGSLVLLQGDFSKFLIVDRVGMGIELIPHLFGASRYPTGTRGLYALWFNNSKILVDNAFRLLQVGP